MFLVLSIIFLFSLSFVNAAEKNLSVEMKSDLNWFRNSHLDIKNSDYYTDKLVHCHGNNYTYLKKIYDFSDEDIQKIELHCQKEGYFRIEGAEVPIEIRECVQSLINFIEDNVEGTFDEEEVLDECLLREGFKRGFSDKNSMYISSLLEERNKEFLRRIDFVKFEEPVNKESTPKGKKVIDPVEKKHNPNYFRNESEDLENFRNELEKKNPSALSKIESGEREEKPRLDIPNQEESDFRGIFRKLFGWLPWFRK